MACPRLYATTPAQMPRTNPHRGIRCYPSRVTRNARILLINLALYKHGYIKTRKTRF